MTKGEAEEMAELIEDLTARIEALESWRASVEKKKEKAIGKTDGAFVWEAYSAAIEKKTGVKPLRNAVTNSQAKALVARVGKEDAVRLIHFYLTVPGFYMQRGYPLSLCLKDCEALYLRMEGAQVATPKQAQAAEEGTGNANAAKQYLQAKHGSKGS